MQKSTKILLTVLTFLVLLLGGCYFLYVASPLPEVKGDYQSQTVQEIAYNAPLKIEFSKQMNQAVTEKSFQIAPEIQGSLSWENKFTLVFTPTNKFAVGQKIHVTVLASAQDFLGKNLAEDFEIDYLIIGAPRVVFVSPANAKELALIKGEVVTEEMQKEPLILPYSPSPLAKEQRPNKITVMFDRPMRELTTLDESETNQKIDFLQITPEVKGVYQWLGTSTLQFQPEELPMSTVFELKIPKGIKALDGGLTEEEYIWHFETERPQILASEPQEGDRFFNPQDPIKLHFNQQVDLDSLYQGLNIYPPKDGFFNGEITFAKGDLTTVIITPNPLLLQPENYTLSIKKGLRGLFGTKATEKELAFHFKTYERAGILNYFPENGAIGIKPSEMEITFATPMLKDSVKQALTVVPEVKNLELSFADEDTKVFINGNFQPGVKYNLEIKKGPKDIFGQILREGLKLEFTMANSDPYVSLLARGQRGLFDENLPPEYYLQSVNLKKVDLEICQISQTDFLKIENNYGWYEYNCSNPTKWEIEIESPLNVYETTTVPLKEKIQGKGIYFFKISSPEYLHDWDKKPYEYRQVFFVTDAALSLKSNNQEVLVWANDLESGEPVEKMEIEIYSLEQQKVIAKGLTDQNGIFQTQVKTGYSFYVFGKKGNVWTMVGSDWAEGIQMWDFGLQSDWYQDNRMFGYLYTDRPIYRPEQEVFFKGILRDEKDVKFNLPKEKEVNVKIEDPFGKIIFENNLPLNENGSFYASVNLAKDASVGNYYLIANLNDNYFSRVFSVEEYRKPEFKIDFLGGQTEFINKERFNTEIQASYYFGGALKDATVQWEIMTDDYYFDQYEGEWYSFSADDNNYWGCYMWGDCSQRQDTVASGEGKLDQNGKLKIDVPIDLSQREMSQLYTLTATITDLNQQAVSHRQTFIVHKGDYYVGIKNRDYVSRTEEEAIFDVITVDQKGGILSGKNIEVDFYQREWTSVQKEGVDGNFYWESEFKDKLVTSQKTKTDSTGKIAVSFKPTEGGYYVAEAKSMDARGNEIKAKASIYISSEAYIGWGVANHDRIDLVVNQKSYKPGDVAEILVKSPFEKEVKALLTIERQKIMQSQVITLKGNSEVIKLPITEEMLPNAFVSVLLFKGSGEEYKVILKQKELALLQDQLKTNVTAQSDLEIEKKVLEADLVEIKNMYIQENKGEYEDLARYKIKQNKLTQIESQLETLKEENATLRDDFETKNSELKKLKLALDPQTLGALEAGQIENIPRPEFKLGYANLLVETEGKRLGLKIQTNKERYLAGEEVTIALKTTDSQGKGVPAEVSLAVVDESILALKSRNLEDLVSFFYQRRGLTISTAQSLVYFIERLNVKAQKGEKGGGGAGQELDQKKRGEFKDTAYWNPKIMTNAQGEAEVKFILPDNLTTWQIWAVGATQKTLVGSMEKDFITTKDLIVRPVLPRFVTMRDKVQIGAIVHNQSLDTQKINVTLTGKNFIFNGNETQKVELKPNTEGKLIWEIEVQDLADFDLNQTMQLNFKAESALFQDEVEVVLPVKTFSVPEFVATSGLTQSVAKEKLYLPNQIDPLLGEMKINVGATLATSFQEGLQFLAEFPYGCAEQTVSRHLPNVILKQLENLFKENGLTEIFSEEKVLQKMITEGVQNLYQLQRFDGGWGYFPESEISYPYLSAYILFGLSETQKAGYQVDANVMQKGVAYLKNCLNKPSSCNPEFYYKLSLDDQAFALWVLSEQGQADLALSQKVFESKNDLSLFAKGYLMLDLMNLTKTEKAVEVQQNLQEKIQTLMAEIEAEALIDTRGAHFEEEKQNYWSMNSNTRTTAILLKTLIAKDVTHPLIPQLIEWLRIQKRDGHWSTTQETVWALLAFNDYFVKSGELKANFNVKVTLNKQEVLNANFDQKNLFTKAEVVALVKDLRIGLPSNEILFTKEGEGNLYYDLTAKYYLPIEEIKERSKGMYLQRAYYALADEKEEKIIMQPKVGEILKGKLTMILPEERHFVLVEEFLPAGFELINFNLETENQNLQFGLKQTEPNWWEDQTWRFYHREFRDDRLSLFADYLPAGVYEFKFLVRATSAGTFQHLPAQISEMYFPENFGRTSGEKITILE